MIRRGRAANAGGALKIEETRLADAEKIATDAGLLAVAAIALAWKLERFAA